MWVLHLHEEHDVQKSTLQKNEVLQISMLTCLTPRMALQITRVRGTETKTPEAEWTHSAEVKFLSVTGMWAEQLWE